jgi:hypothetical protein
MASRAANSRLQRTRPAALPQRECVTIHVAGRAAEAQDRWAASLEPRQEMDLTDVLQKRIDTLPLGDHVLGLRAVLQHIQVATAHLLRGEKTGDNTAFTDAIYRTNQAFEGSLKEAYRVLASKDPTKVRPFDIEAYFQKNTVLRTRVLSQFSMYRTEWRNPSAHDYRLDFDEDEALLAIVSVSAFAIVLSDQISEKLNFDRARATSVPMEEQQQAGPLLAGVAEALMSFRYEATHDTAGAPPRELELVGAIAGHITGSLPGVRVETDAVLSSERAERADVLVFRESEKVLVEVKRVKRGPVRFGYVQLLHYMDLAEVKEAIRFVYTDDQSTGRERSDHTVPGTDLHIVTIAPPVRTAPPN